MPASAMCFIAGNRLLRVTIDRIDDLNVTSLALEQHPDLSCSLHEWRPSGWASLCSLTWVGAGEFF